MSSWHDDVLEDLDPSLPVLIAGPTASGKSSLAMRIAQDQGGRIINADAIQVYSDWCILTARPSEDDEQVAEHALFGHVAGETAYSVGDWIRDLAPLLSGPRPIIVGGTGLYFSALTEGLAEIPETPAEIRAEADKLVVQSGHEMLLDDLDAQTVERLDTQNPVRVQRAWEVQRTTGRGLASWQDETPPPLLPINQAQTVLLSAEPDWLNPRISQRFDVMMQDGLMDEARANEPYWHPKLPSSKAIGAAELMEYLAGRLTQSELSDSITILTRQYAKRQRTWFRSRMKLWNIHPCH